MKLTYMIENLNKEKDWNYTLAIDSLSSMKILMSKKGKAKYQSDQIMRIGSVLGP